jgi:dCMP deaminase
MAEKKKVPPRLTPDRDSKYMGLAWMMAGFSKDPSTQIGSMIINSDNRPLGWGYNGPPRAIDDNSFSWERPEKYDYVKHAEDNALCHSHGCLDEATLYVTGLPCKACMLDIVDAGIKRVVYMDKRYDAASMQAQQDDINRVHDIAQKAGVKLEKFKGNIGWIQDWVMHLKGLGIFDL